LSVSFQDLGLSADIARAVAEQGYTQPTPIQAQAIPVILQGRDVLAAAQTGTGKTAGFTLPMLQRLAPKANASTSPARHPVRALVVTPTRELAAQVEESVRIYGRHVRLRSSLVYGGVGMTPQVEALRSGVDILVATPGRLLDHVQQKTVDLSQVEILVLDEADRMLDMGFIHDIKRILALLPAKRQNLLFSATFSDDIRRLASGLLRDPVMVEVARRNAESELVEQRVYAIERDRKRHLLSHLVRSGDWRQVLVFTKTKHGANRLAEQLARDGIETAAIHGNKSQPQRLKALASFKDGSVRVLVATDIAARGLDIEELPHVVNYELPHVAEDYVHRIGRTGRAGSRGEAISLVSAEEKPLLAAIEKLIRRQIERTSVPALDIPAAPETRSGAQPQRGETAAAPDAARGERPDRSRRQGRPSSQSRPGGSGSRQQRPEGQGRRPSAGAARGAATGERAAPARQPEHPPTGDRAAARGNGQRRRGGARDDRDLRPGEVRPRREQPAEPRHTERRAPARAPEANRPPRSVTQVTRTPMPQPAAASAAPAAEPERRGGTMAALFRFFSPRPDRAA